MQLSTSCIVVAALLAPSSLAQGDHVAELLGPATLVNDMNVHGEVVGWTVTNGVRAYVTGPDHPYELLPLPTGYASAWAQGINDAGSIVGSASTGSFPEFGEACAWHPVGDGTWTVELLGALPGQTQSVAYDINNRGDIVGLSINPGFGGGPTVWFNAPGGILELSSLGAPSSPKEINDEGVVVGINGGLFDIDTLTPIPLPAFAAGMTQFQGWAISNSGSLAGKAFHGSQISASIWTETGNWEPMSLLFGQSAPIQAFDVNDAGLAYAETPTPSARIPGVGTLPLTSLLVPAQQGSWSFVTSLGGAVDEAGRIAAIGVAPNGQSGVVVLTPEQSKFEDLGAGLAGVAGVPVLEGEGTLLGGDPTTLTLSSANPGSAGVLVAGFGELLLPVAGGTLVPSPDVLVPISVGATGVGVFVSNWPPGLPAGAQLTFQEWIVDPSTPAGFSASNGLRATAP